MADQQSTDGRLRELALFAGAGGGILGGLLLGWRTVCAVERDAYAASVLAQRQNDGVLEPFPIWSDVETFDGTEWRGLVDVVSGGFPCTDISCAGKGAGIDGDASGLWREMARIVGEVRPRFVFVENSPLLVRRGLARVLGDLASLGYDARWCCVSAYDVGAPHIRDRIWILGHGSFLSPNSISDRIREQSRRSSRTSGKEKNEPSVDGAQRNASDHESVVGLGKRRKQDSGIGDSWRSKNGWPAEPDVVRVVYGLANRVDRIRALGNGQVPRVAAAAWRILSDER